MPTRYLFRVHLEVLVISLSAYQSAPSYTGTYSFDLGVQIAVLSGEGTADSHLVAETLGKRISLVEAG